MPTFSIGNAEPGEVIIEVAEVMNGQATVRLRRADAVASPISLLFLAADDVLLPPLGPATLVSEEEDCPGEGCQFAPLTLRVGDVDYLVFGTALSYEPSTTRSTLFRRCIPRPPDWPVTTATTAPARPPLSFSALCRRRWDRTRPLS